MPQTLAIVVGAESDDSRRQYPDLLSSGIVAERCFRPRRSAAAAAADLAQATSPRSIAPLASTSRC